MTEKFKSRVEIYSQIAIIVAFAVVFTIAAKSFVIPLAFSFLFAIILNPLVRRFDRWGLQRILSILLAMLIFFLIIGAIAAYSTFQLSLLMEDLPSIQQRVIELFNSLARRLERLVGTEFFQENNIWQNALGNAGPIFSNLVSTTSSAATVLVQVPIYVFLILLYKERFKRFGAAVAHSSDKAEERINEIKSVVQSYVSGLFIVILILAVLNSVGLWALGIKYALFFGIFSAILTVIPYLGNFLGGLFPFLVALVTKDSAWYAVGVVAIYAFIQFLEGNFITPNIMGSRVSVNPLAALLSLIIGAQLLGLTGVILAIPILGIIKTALSHSATLKPLIILIEDEPPGKKNE